MYSIFWWLVGSRKIVSLFIGDSLIFSFFGDLILSLSFLPKLQKNLFKCVQQYLQDVILLLLSIIYLMLLFLLLFFSNFFYLSHSKVFEGYSCSLLFVFIIHFFSLVIVYLSKLLYFLYSTLFLVLLGSFFHNLYNISLVLQDFIIAFVIQFFLGFTLLALLVLVYLALLRHIFTFTNDVI